MTEYINELYFDQPIEYKKLFIYPVKMRDYLIFHSVINCLLIDKNSIPDAKTIEMSYLRFLYKEAEKGMPYLYMLKVLMCVVLHLDFDSDIKFYTDEKDKAFFSINGEIYNSSDFDKIVDIIFEQNCISHIDETIQKELRDELLNAQKYKQQINNQKMCSLEEQMICVLISTPLKLEDIYNLTIRKFQKILQRVDAKLHYEIYLSASTSGMVKFKNEDFIKHWLSDLSEKDEFADAKVDFSKLKNKIKDINK